MFAPIVLLTFSKAVPAIRNRIKLFLKDPDTVPTMPLSAMCPEGQPWGSVEK